MLGTESANCDLWKQVFDALEIKQIQLEVRWMPSHLGLGANDSRPDGVSHFDVLANDQADKEAGKAAQKAAIPHGIAKHNIYYVDLAIKIQKRLAVILLNLPARQVQKADKKKPEPRISLDHLLKDTSHSITTIGARLHCTKCLNNFKIGDPSCKHWLATMCAPEESSGSRPQVIQKPIPIELPIHIGNQVSHSSHKLQNYKGLFFAANVGPERDPIK